ncbi:CDP-alcohol phosphatidyltransferase family protein [Amnibacterium sp.]|uniref:CDP-alcohol phosphatidyltransferase family protein n=1 Tax=Amnibacterium sp. TaxID=1872496 RepID=UPI0026194C8F|nr:CDP-alcohol phosphatidyltransferase family protein [Amnibacterium sp.]MCU1473188.1 CDP-alcohol phosphatidyltransferase family protein [Amnibacterium sp.]
MPSDEPVSDELLTIPNLLSLARVALIPVFLGFLITGQDVLALVVLVAGGVTDFLDGFLARRLHQVTRLGKLLDPVADRLTILSATIGLTYRGFLPLWLLLVVLARDVGMLCLGAVLARHRTAPPPVTRVGKAATFLLLSALPLLVVAGAFPGTARILLPIGIGVAVVGAALYWAAGIGYTLSARRTIVGHRNDTPEPSATLIRQRRSPDGR